MSNNSAVVPWLRVGVRLQHPQSAEEAVKMSQLLDYTVQKRPLRAVLGRIQLPVEGHYATVRTDNGRCLGVIKRRYCVIQNDQAFSFLSSLANRDLSIETGGVVDGGRKAWLLVRLPLEMRIGRFRDGMRKHLLVVNSHDGSTNITVKPTAIRIVCSNSIPAILRSSDAEIRIRHTAQAHDRLSEIHSVLKKAEDAFQEMELLLIRMSLRRLSNKELLDYVKRLIPDNEDVTSHSRTENLRRRIVQLSEDGIGAEIYRGSLMSVVNAVAEACDRQPAKDANRHLKSIWFGGSGQQLKERALRLAESML